MDKLDTKEIPEKPESIFLRISLKNRFMLEKLKIYEKEYLHISGKTHHGK